MPEWLRKAPVRTFSLAICKVLNRGTQVYRLCRKLLRLRADSLGPRWQEASSQAVLPDPPFSGSTGTSTRAHPAFPLRQPRVTWRHDGGRSHRGPRQDFSPPSGGCGPTAPTTRKSALLLPPSLRSPASPALSHSARYSGPAIAFLSSAAHRLPVSPAPTTSTRSMAAAEARSVAGLRGHRVPEIVRTVPWAGRLRRRGRGSPQRWPRPRPPAPACTGARRVSPESHRPLEKDLEGTASAWASEEDCSEEETATMDATAGFLLEPCRPLLVTERDFEIREMFWLQ